MIKEVKGNELFFAKVKEGATIPTKDLENAGYDVYSCFEENFMLIQPHETKMIPSGIASACSVDYYIQLKEKGGTGSKGIAQRCGVVDSGFRGEWFIPVTNTTNKCLVIAKNPEEWNEKEVIVHKYTKAITQAVVLPVPRMDVKEISIEELKAIPSQRGEGCLGSSGK